MQREQTDAALDRHFDAVEKIILSRQDAVTGLLPASTAVNAHGDYTDAWVRDNVYSILCVWGLALSYKRFYGDHQRTHLLSQSVVKLMRGLLTAMMRQSDRVERFKYTLDPTDALHAKYGTKTGLAVVGDDEWGHLQIDATSIFLLMLAQMTASGLKIVFTQDEVDFVQNLVHYISRSYCAPDYGIWERGNKINKGATEINCSSVGMAKAALEAIDGLNLFGSAGGDEAVIHVVASDVARARFTLESLLPRESTSKETDAALLSIVGYPAYAIENEALVERTRKKIIKKLCGNYGCKRFLLDGHQSVLEDTSRLHYEPEELRQFAHIESEWPLFFTYLLLDALMRGDGEAAQLWRGKLEPLFVEQDGQRLLPELYIVPQEAIEAEKAEPGSQKRIPNENIPLVWAQSLYMLSEMISDGLLRPADIDPLHRRERIGHRRRTQILVPIIAQNASVKARLLELGFASETPDEIKPVFVRHASELTKVHRVLGKNEKLHLSGRPELVARTITTSQLYIIDGEENLFLPYYFDPKGFYFSYDNQLLTEHFRTSLSFLSSSWDKPGQPIVPFWVREDMLLEKDRDAILSLLHDVQTGLCGEMRLKSGRVAQLLTTVATERLQGLEEIRLDPLYRTTQRAEVDLLSCAGEESYVLSSDELQRIDMHDDESLGQMLLSSRNRRMQAYIAGILWRRRGGDFPLQTQEGEITLRHFAEALYTFATRYHDWAVVRRMAQLTGKFDDRLEDVLLDIVIRQKRLAVGRAYSERAIFANATDNHAILEAIDAFCGENPAEGVLTQEIILHLGYLVRTEPERFETMFTLRTWYFVQLLVGQIGRECGCAMSEAYERLLELAPHAIYERLRRVLRAYSVEVRELIEQENLRVQGSSTIAPMAEWESSPEDAGVEDWHEWRRNAGMIGRLSPTFYKDIWHMLQRCHALVIGEKYHLRSRIGSELTLESTPGEQSFALKIDALLQGIGAPDYRQINIEIIETLSRLFKENQQLRVENDLILDVLIGHAVRIAWEKEHGGDYNEQRGAAWAAFYRLSPKEADAAFIEAFLYLLSPGEQHKDEVAS